MPGFEELGGGNKLLKVDSVGQGGPIEQFKNVATLAELAAKLRKAPAELAKAEAEATLSQNQVAQIGVENALKLANATKAVHEAGADVLAVEDAKRFADLSSTLGTERRAKSEFALKSIGDIPKALGTNFELGKGYVKGLIANGIIPPGSQVAKNDDGTFAIGLAQPGGGFDITNVDPNRLGTPEQRTALEDKLRGGWEKVGQGFATVDEFYRNMKTNIKLGSGPGDVATIFSFMKMMDRNTAVREGQFATAENAPAIPERIRNLYNSALDAKGPKLGEADSQARKDFEDSADVIYDNAKKDALLHAKFFGDSAKASGANPLSVVQPYGGIQYNDKTGLAEINDSLPKRGVPTPLTDKAVAAAVPQGMGTANTAQSAGAGNPNPANSAPAEKPAVPERVEDTLKNMFTLPGGM